MTNLIDNREIRIFISSTFRDMQEERDYLFDHVFPKIRKIAEQRDVRVVEIDLRWGITYEESANGRVMQICFEEIERCRPFFIGILGDRYGWCPDLDEIKRNQDLNVLYPWVEEYIAQGKSVTDMEMQLGALCHELQCGQEVRAHFYIKEDSQETISQQKILKEIVRQNTDVPNCNYSSVEQLGELVEQDLIMLLDELYPLEECTPFMSAVTVQRSVLRSMSFGIIPKPHVIDKLNEFLESEKRYCILQGEKNCGKTSTIAYWLNRISSNIDFTIFYYFVGVSPSNSCQAYTEYTKKYMLKQFSIDNDAKICSYDFARFCYNACLNKKVIFVIDGVDQFEDSYINPTSYLPWVPKGSKVIISANTQTVKNTDCANVEEPLLVELEHFSENLDWRFIFKCLKGKNPNEKWVNEYRRFTISLPLLSKQDIKNNLIYYFRQFGKKLTLKQIKCICDDPKSKNANNLAILSSYLRTLPNPDDLEGIINRYNNISDCESFIAFILDKIEKKFGYKNVKNYLLSLYVSRKGIPEYDLRHICLQTQIEFSPLHYAMEIFVKNLSGYLMLKNETTIKLVEERYTGDDINEARGRIVDYYLKNGVFSNCIVDEQSKMWIFELPYQCNKLHRLEDLFYVICQPQVCLSQLGDLWWSLPWECNVGEISEYWNTLFASGRYSLDIYFSNYRLYISHSPMALCYISMLSYICSGYEQAMAYIDQSIQIYSSHDNRCDKALLLLMMMRAHLYSETNDNEGVKDSLLLAFDLCGESLTAMDCSNYLSNIIKDLENVCDEEELYQISIKADGYYKLVENHSCYIRGYLDNLLILTNLHMKRDKFDDALTTSLKSVDISRRFKNIDLEGFYISDVNYAFNEFYCAKILQQMKRETEALEHARIAEDIYSKHYEDKDINFETTNINKMHRLCKRLIAKLQGQ